MERKKATCESCGERVTYVVYVQSTDSYLCVDCYY